MRVVRSIVVGMLLVTAAACSGNDDGDTHGKTSTASSSAVPQDDGTTGPIAGGAKLPKKGDCWTLSAEQLDPGMALTSTEVPSTDCAAAHNAITVDVVAIPTGQDASIGALAQSGQTLNPQDDELWKSTVVPACSTSYADALGGAVEVNKKWAEGAYRSVNLSARVWLPTADEWATGARWIRCDFASRTGSPIALAKPVVDMKTVPDELASCLNANAEGYLYVPCDDPLANAQALVTMVLSNGNADAAKSAYEDYLSSLAPMICQETVAKAYPGVTAEAKAALPIKQAFTGTYDCYVSRSPGDPLIK